MPDRPATAEIAAWIAEQGNSPLPITIVDHAYRALIDHLGAALAGSIARGSAELRAFAAQAYPGSEATMVGGRERASVLGAAYANGCSAHALDIDDGYTAGSMHPGSVVLPVALALGERMDLPVDRTLVAAVIGVEVACRISAAGHPAVREAGWHNVNTAGVFGATAAACSLLHLRPDQVQSALGLAASHAGGLLRFLDGDYHVKRIHAGKAAQDGLVCADLASRGVTGPGEILEGRNGFFAVFAGGRWDADRLLGDLGVRFESADTYLKPYPGCRHAHSAVDAALRLVRGNRLATEDVAAITVTVSPYAIRHSGSGMGSVLEAQLNIPYNVAAAIARGRLSTVDFDEPARRDPTILALMDRVCLIADPQFDEGFPVRRPATVRLDLADGRTLSEHIPQPFGDASNPLSDEDLAAKFRGLADPVDVLPNPFGFVAGLKSIESTRQLMASLGRRQPA